MSDLHLDLKNTSFIKSPANAKVDLYEQYAYNLGDVRDRHAQLVSILIKKDSTDWFSDSYQHAKSFRCQFERTWRRAKNPINRSQKLSAMHLLTRINQTIIVTTP